MENLLGAAVPAIISAAGAVLVCLINSHYQANATRNLIEYKITELTKRVEKHNNVIQRTFQLEQKNAVYEEQIKVINHRIQDLEDLEKNSK